MNKKSIIYGCNKGQLDHITNLFLFSYVWGTPPKRNYYHVRLYHEDADNLSIATAISYDDKQFKVLPVALTKEMTADFVWSWITKQHNKMIVTCLDRDFEFSSETKDVLVRPFKITINDTQMKIERVV